jgi:lipoprotein LprG
MRRLLAIPAVASVVVALVASCSSSPSTSSSSSSSSPPPLSSPPSSKRADDPLPDPAAVLKESSRTAKGLKSVRLVLSVAGKIAEMPVRTLEGDVTNEPSIAAKGNAKVAIMGADVDIRFVELDRRLYVALPGEDFKDYGHTSKVYDVAAILNPDTGLANMLADFIDPKVEARETVGSEQTVRVAGKVTADAVNKVVPLDATKRMPATVWIQERGDHQLVQAKLEPSKDDSIEMVFSNWNVPVIVDKPAGA